MGMCVKCGTNFIGTAANPPRDGLCRYCERDALIAERDALRAKMDASERACAEMREALEKARASLNSWNSDELYHLACEAIRRAFSSDAGRDYVSRAEVDAAWRKGMTDAAKIARDLVVDEAHNAPHNWITSDAIIDARDKRKENSI